MAACQAGQMKAVPMPMQKVSSSTGVAATSPVPARSAMMAAHSAIYRLQ